VPQAQRARGVATAQRFSRLKIARETRREWATRREPREGGPVPRWLASEARKNPVGNRVGVRRRAQARTQTDGRGSRVSERRDAGHMRDEGPEVSLRPGPRAGRARQTL